MAVLPVRARRPLTIVADALNPSSPTTAWLGAIKTLESPVLESCETTICWAKDRPNTWTPAAMPAWTAPVMSPVSLYAMNVVARNDRPNAQEHVTAPVAAS